MNLSVEIRNHTKKKKGRQCSIAILPQHKRIIFIAFGLRAVLSATAKLTTPPQECNLALGDCSD